MAAADYYFVDKWRAEGDVFEIADLIEDSAGLTRWWPSVYFEYEELGPGDEKGVGKLIRLHAGGWLPCTLWINFLPVESNYPHGFTLEATGDMVSSIPAP